MNVQTEYNPNRITSRGFFGKPVGSMDWSSASNKPIYSLHKGNASLSSKNGLIGLAAALKLDRFQKSNESVNKTETNSDKKSLDTNKEEEIIKVKNEEHEITDQMDRQEDAKEIKLSYLSEPVNHITETNPVIYLPPDEESLDAENSDTESDEEEETEDDDVKSDSESDDEEKELEDDVKEILADDSSICCRSDTSNNSISSFSFPILHNEEGSVKKPYFERSWNVVDKRLELPREETQTRTQPQFYFIPASHMLIHHLPPQQNSSSNQGLKRNRNRNRKKLLGTVGSFAFMVHFKMIDSRN
ncbi:unnamed protein product [Arabis nemorensis]|uniref:Uncharacterized protein n=1 Tax=Arabis nemorensis TaxID=586526 RepID=A0A565CLN4_9BRAS|nr:unnamed protein product [Arabis nemorensis]